MNRCPTCCQFGLRLRCAFSVDVDAGVSYVEQGAKDESFEVEALAVKEMCGMVAYYMPLQDLIGESQEMVGEASVLDFKCETLEIDGAAAESEDLEGTQKVLVAALAYSPTSSNLLSSMPGLRRLVPAMP